MENITIPDRVSNAGPDTREPDYDWRDHLDFAGDCIRAAERAERTWHACPENNTAGSVNRDRISAINNAIEQLERAKELLCR